jgi:hypothetical protein
LLDEAARRDLTLRETVGLLCEREIARKDERRIEMALSIAKFPFVRDLAGFDFEAQPSLDPPASWPPAGSSPMARRCCSSARPASARVTWRWRSAARRSSPATRCSSSRPPPWSPPSSRRTPTAGSTTSSAGSPSPSCSSLVGCGVRTAPPWDEPGDLPFEPNAAHLFFRLVARRYQRGRLLVTSNRAIGERGTVFGDPVVATAILDRLLPHSHVVTLRGASCRPRETRRSGLPKAAPLAPGEALAAT